MGKKKVDDRFNKFGTVSFTGTTRINDFIDHLEQGKVMGSRCKDCGEMFFPPRADCCKCLTSNMEWFEVAGPGKLVTYSRLKYAPVGFEEDLPYSIAVLDYGAYKVFGRIADDVSEDDIKIGMEMTTKVNTPAEDKLNFVFHKI